MTSAILDTNVLLRGVIGSPAAASFRALEANDAGRYRLVFSPATIDELLDVLLLAKMRRRHGRSDDEILRFLTSLLSGAIVRSGHYPIPPRVTRDVSDAKLLSLAAESGADYLVTLDRRHLLRLKRYGRTRIVTPAHFLRLLE